ncbi:addiction module toxin RelE [Fusobacterium nucleatum subsp. nucleatum ATCC 23726]|uniref:Toxin-antitoxin system, toxin component, RelE family n=1 Tax=Fusobacterium nucleatum subsp. nucleatum (strain ATCC 23726 / VPI 4351) TaxID=525283 RepID=D5RFE8_FUSN2|nr:toxin-antitoxin system, toxin component, RelE family [Fusobacterium nucleatum subsp. nucleatum ATCC 23726]
MEIRYKNKRIRDICENEKKAIKKYNKIIAEKLIFSIEFLKNSKSLKDVADYNNFRLHELKYERKGQFAIDLGKTTGYRLIIEPVTAIVIEEPDLGKFILIQTNYRTCYCQQRK